MRSFNRRAALSAFALLALAACGSATGDDTGPSAPAANSDGIVDMVLGNADAPVTLIEYASITCGACLQFHQAVMPTIKEDYVETGLVRFVFREFPTPPANVAIAGFAMARCAGPDKYYDVIDDLFEAQPGILAATRQGAVKPALMTIAARHGIVGEEAFDACISDREIRQTIADVILTGEEYAVQSTPTLILQGNKLENTFQARSADGLSALIDLELAALGIERAAEDENEAEAPVDTAPVDDTADAETTEAE